MTEFELKPLVTEKSERAGVHAFAVPLAANKPLIRAEIKRRHKVTPLKINIVRIRGKKIVVRGRSGERPDTKKALVYLKAGDKITAA